jgi:MFS family permease
MRPAAGRIIAISVPGIMVSFGCLVIFTFGAFVKPLNERFGWSRGEISLAFTFAALMIAISSPLLGRAMDRIGVRRVLLPCVAVYCAAFTSLSLIGSLAALYAAYIVMGIVGNGTAHLAWARVISTSFDKRRGIALATMMAGVGAGAIGIPPLATWLIGSFGWSATCLLLGAAIFAFGFLPPLLFLPDVRGSRNPGSRTGAFRSVRADRIFWLLMGGFFFFSISINGVIAHLIPMLTDRGLHASAAAFAASMLGALTLIGRLLTGALLDRFHGSYIGGLFFALAAIGVAALSQAATIPAAYTAAGLVGLGLGAEADVMPYLISRYFPMESFSEIYGYSFTAYAIAAAFGPLLMGWSFDQFHSYSNAALALAGAMMVGAITVGFLPAYRVTEVAKAAHQTPEWAE